MFYLADGRKSLYQWDLDRRIIASDDELTELHFYYTSEETLIVKKKSDDNIGDYFEIPNILLQSSGGIRFYGCVDEYTKEVGQFNVTARPKPADYIYTETEVITFNELVDNVNRVINQANEAIEDVNNLLDNITNYIKADTELSIESDKPVQNKVIAQKFIAIENLINSFEEELQIINEGGVE